MLLLTRLNIVKRFVKEYYTCVCQFKVMYIKLFDLISMRSLFSLIIYWLFLSSVLVGCTSNRDSTLENAMVVNLSLNQRSKINEKQIIIEKVIQLETTSDCVVGKINKILLKGDKIFIVDFMNSKLVLCFSSHGDFIKKVSDFGKAGGEYLFNRDFIEKSDGSGFLLFDKRLKKLIQYDNKLNFVNEVDVPISVNSLVELNNEFIVERSSQSDFFVNICDAQFHIKEKKVKRPQYQLNYDFNNPYPFKLGPGDTLCYNPSFSNIIYEYKNNEFVARYLLKDRKGFPNKAFFESNSGVHPGRLLQRFQKDGFLSFLDFYENSNILLLKYFRGADRDVTLYSKHGHHVVTYNTSNKKIMSVLLNNVLAVDGDGNFVSYIFPYQLLDNKGIEFVSNKIDKLLPALNSQGNPIIVYLKIKSDTEKNF